MKPKGTNNKVNLLALRRYYTHPHELYNTLRSQDGIFFDETSQAWLVTGHAAARFILDTPCFLSNINGNTQGSAPLLPAVTKQFLFLDGDAHQQAQKVILKPLATLVRRMPAEIANIVQTTLNTYRAKGEMEVVSEFAGPIALLTIAHVLGMPVDDMTELQQLERWSDTFGDITSGYFRGDIQDIHKLEDYFRRLIARKRQEPTEDLLSACIAAKDVFPDEESLITNCMMIFAAGRITTKKLLGNGISLLMPLWEQYQKEARENPQFAKPLGEELLRMVTPTRYLMREAREDVKLADFLPSKQVIRRGGKILVFLEAANYDPSVFSLPQQYNPLRRPNPHLAFGFGPHQCPGATLARIEIQTALAELLSLANLHAKPGISPTWNPNPNLGGFTANYVMFNAAINHMR